MNIINYVYQQRTIQLNRIIFFIYFFFFRICQLLRLSVICSGLSWIYVAYSMLMPKSPILEILPFPSIFMIFNVYPGYHIFLMYVCFDRGVVSILRKRLPKTMTFVCCGKSSGGDNQNRTSNSKTSKVSTSI